MPAKNRIKEYLEGGYYHLYNRGVNKNEIFTSELDYNVFLNYLKQYLLPIDKELLKKNLAEATNCVEKEKALSQFKLRNFSEEITMLAFCLMPNHFHFLVKQKSAGGIDNFMNSIGTRYTMYFNKKHQRIGPLYQGVYKAVLVKNENQFLHLSRYIHKQALRTKGQAFRAWQPSSYPVYAGAAAAAERRPLKWVKPEELLAYFSKTNPRLSYAAFVNEINIGDSLSFVSKVALEDVEEDLP